MRITFLLPALTLNGGVKAVRRIADGLVDRGHRVTLLAADAKPWPPPWRPRTFVKHVRERVNDLRVGRGSFLDGTRAELVRLDALRHTPADVPDSDVLIATWWETAESMRDFGANKGQKFYFVQADETQLCHPDARERVRATYRLPYRHICVSTFLADMMRTEYGHPHAALAPVGVDEIFFRARERVRNRVPTVGVLYNAHYSKGWDDAVRAFHLLRARLPHVAIVTFGAHPVNPRHQLLDMSFELRPPQRRIAELSSSVDVWLLPSVREGFGLPPIEAAAGGTPVVATKSGGPADYVREGENGYLVDVSDAAGMADALLKVLTCDDAKWRAMSDASRRIAETFRWPSSVEAFERALAAP